MKKIGGSWGLGTGMFQRIGTSGYNDYNVPQRVGKMYLTYFPIIKYIMELSVRNKHQAKLMLTFCL